MSFILRDAIPRQMEGNWVMQINAQTLKLTIRMDGDGVVRVVLRDSELVLSFKLVLVFVLNVDWLQLSCDASDGC